MGDRHVVVESIAMQYIEEALDSAISLSPDGSQKTRKTGSPGSTLGKQGPLQGTYMSE